MLLGFSTGYYPSRMAYRLNGSGLLTVFLASFSAKRSFLLSRSLKPYNLYKVSIFLFSSSNSLTSFEPCWSLENLSYFSSPFISDRILSSFPATAACFDWNRVYRCSMTSSDICSILSIVTLNLNSS
jgi:hypothetical protein